MGRLDILIGFPVGWDVPMATTFRTLSIHSGMPASCMCPCMCLCMCLYMYMWFTCLPPRTHVHMHAGLPSSKYRQERGNSAAKKTRISKLHRSVLPYEVRPPSCGHLQTGGYTHVHVCMYVCHTLYVNFYQPKFFVGKLSAIG